MIRFQQGAMHFEIGTLGNHEFDEGLAEYMRIVNGGEPTKQYNKAEMAYPHVKTGINIITANVVNKSDGQIPFGMQPYLIKEIHTSDGKVARIGFIGIETTSLPILTLYDNYKDYDVLDEAETIAVTFASVLILGASFSDSTGKTCETRLLGAKSLVVGSM